MRGESYVDSVPRREQLTMRAPMQGHSRAAPTINVSTPRRGMGFTGWLARSVPPSR